MPKYLIKKVVTDEKKGVKVITYRNDFLSSSKIDDLLRKYAFTDYHKAHDYLINNVMYYDNLTKCDLKFEYDIIDIEEEEKQ